MNDLPDTADRPARPFRGTRLLGVVLLVIGLVVSYFEIVQPLQEAALGVRSISWTDSWSFMGLLCGLFGLSIAIYPKILSENSFVYKNKSKLSIWGWLMLAALVAMAFVLNSRFHGQFAKYGYHIVSSD